jgi:hypothetical protein
MDVMAELRSIGALFTAGDYSSGSEKLRDLWEKIPEPKTATLNSYLIIEYAVAFALKAGELDEARRWAELAPEFSKVRQDMGEVEFLIGKVAFERGDYESAKRNFVVANIKSEGRSFHGKDPKYKNLIQ